MHKSLGLCVELTAPVENVPPEAVATIALRYDQLVFLAFSKSPTLAVFGSEQSRVALRKWSLLAAACTKRFEEKGDENLTTG